MVGINRDKLEEINIVSLIKVANKNILYSCPFITEYIAKELINKKCGILVELNYYFIDSIDSLKLVIDLISNNIKEIIGLVKFNEYNKIVNKLRNFINVVYIDISRIKVFEKEVSMSNIIKQNNKTRLNEGTTGIKVFF